MPRGKAKEKEVQEEKPVEQEQQNQEEQNQEESSGGPTPISKLEVNKTFFFFCFFSNFAFSK